MKIEDGFDAPTKTVETRQVAVTEKSYGLGTIISFVGVTLLAAVLGFLGGIQVNKGSSTQAMQGGFGGPGGMSSTTSSSTGTNTGTGTMLTPPSGMMPGQTTNGTSSTSSSSTSPTPSTTTN